MNKQDLLKVQTCVIRVNIHCDGCKQKVKKTLQKVEGGKSDCVWKCGSCRAAEKANKIRKHAELWGGNGNKGLPKDFQFMNMMQMGGKDGGKIKKGGGGNIGGGKDPMKGGSLPPQFKGFKDMKAPSKDQKSFNFNLRGEHGEDDEDDYSDDEDYGDEDYSDYEDYTDDDGDGSEEEFDHKHPPPKMMPPVMNGKAHGQAQAVNAMNMMMMNDKMKGKGGGGGGGGGGGNAADMKAMMMMLNEKKVGAGGNGGAGGGKGKKDKHKYSDDEAEDDSDFDMPIIKMGGKEGKKGDGKNKEGKGKHGGGGVMKSIGGLFGGGKKKKSKGGGEFEKNKNDDHHEHDHHGGNGGKTKGGSGGGGPKMGHMGPMSHMNMGHQAGPMGNFHAVQGLPAQGGMNPGYYNPAMGQGNPYNHQQQQYMAMMMNQQQQQQAGMQGGGEMYHSMMYARPHPAVNYANGYVPPMPPPSHANPYSHMFSDENAEGCSIM